MPAYVRSTERADELDAQITDIADNQESITVELDTSESLENGIKRSDR